MGFLKRFFSLGSKKSKKNKRDNRQNATDHVDASGRILRSNTPEPWQIRDGDANRLLRSSSAHFRVVREVDYSTLPPLREQAQLHPFPTGHFSRFLSPPNKYTRDFPNAFTCSYACFNARTSTPRNVHCYCTRTPMSLPYRIPPRKPSSRGRVTDTESGSTLLR